MKYRLAFLNGTSDHAAVAAVSSSSVHLSDEADGHVYLGKGVDTSRMDPRFVSHRASGRWSMPPNTDLRDRPAKEIQYHAAQRASLMGGACCSPPQRDSNDRCVPMPHRRPSRGGCVPLSWIFRFGSGVSTITTARYVLEGNHCRSTMLHFSGLVQFWP